MVVSVALPVLASLAEKHLPEMIVKGREWNWGKAKKAKAVGWLRRASKEHWTIEQIAAHRRGKGGRG